ncbi:MAG: DUF4159 domain-containing protein [Chthoniobacter sp.]
MNLSFRLQQMTSIKVNPDGTRPPAHRSGAAPLSIHLHGGTRRPSCCAMREVEILRRYLLHGGFLMVDDFWGEWQWEGFAEQMKRVFPDRDFVELPMSHEIFHCVFDLGTEKNKLQTPNERLGANSKYTGVTWERHVQKDGSYEECTEMHVRAPLRRPGPHHGPGHPQLRQRRRLGARRRGRLFLPRVSRKSAAFLSASTSSFT